MERIISSYETPQIIDSHWDIIDLYVKHKKDPGFFTAYYSLHENVVYVITNKGDGLDIEKVPFEKSSLREKLIIPRKKGKNGIFDADHKFVIKRGVVSIEIKDDAYVFEAHNHAIVIEEAIYEEYTTYILHIATGPKWVSIILNGGNLNV